MAVLGRICSGYVNGWLRPAAIAGPETLRTTHSSNVPCGIRIWDTYDSEPGPTLELDDKQFQYRIRHNHGSPNPSEKGRFDCSAIRVPGYPREDLRACSLVVWPNRIRAQTRRFRTQTFEYETYTKTLDGMTQRSKEPIRITEDWGWDRIGDEKVPCV